LVSEKGLEQDPNKKKKKKKNHKQKKQKKKKKQTSYLGGITEG